jgi:hypothetical protein
MIHEIGVELQAAIASRRCPFEVIDGPEFRDTSTFGRERIVIEYDGDDGYVATHKAGGPRPITIYSRQQACKITIYAKSPSKGATYWEHQRRASKVLDFVLVGLYKVAKERKNLLEVKSGHFMLPDDFKGTETPGGAKYELKFTFDRGVADRLWDDTADPSTTLDATTVTSAETGATTATITG